MATLAQLHKHIGDTVVVRYGQRQDAPLYIPPTRLVIVGTAAMPAVGSSGIFADHTSMGTGALVSTGIEPPPTSMPSSAGTPHSTVPTWSS
jgi:hypothetical protein